MYNYAKHIFFIILHYENQVILPKNFNRYNPVTNTNSSWIHTSIHLKCTTKTL